MVYYRMIKHLRTFFDVTTVDFLGMGVSGRPKFILKDCQDSIDYFMLSMRAWMETTSYHGEPYYVCGHSLGGYLMSLYSLTYPENIQKLILMSPVGLPERPEEFTVENLMSR